MDKKEDIFFVTEFMDSGDLFDALFFGDTPISWKYKLKIALGILPSSFYSFSFLCSPFYLFIFFILLIYSHIFTFACFSFRRCCTSLLLSASKDYSAQGLEEPKYLGMSWQQKRKQTQSKKRKKEKKREEEEEQRARHMFISFIQITEGFKAKLCDLGLARVIDASNKRLTFVGTDVCRRGWERW